MGSDKGRKKQCVAAERRKGAGLSEIKKKMYKKHCIWKEPKIFKKVRPFSKNSDGNWTDFLSVIFKAHKSDSFPSS